MADGAFLFPAFAALLRTAGSYPLSVRSASLQSADAVPHSHLATSCFLAPAQQPGVAAPDWTALLAVRVADAVKRGEGAPDSGENADEAAEGRGAALRCARRLSFARHASGRCCCDDACGCVPLAASPFRIHYRAPLPCDSPLPMCKLHSDITRSESSNLRRQSVTFSDAFIPRFVT